MERGLIKTLSQPMILDIHTHAAPPRLDAVISCTPDSIPPEDAFPGQNYSVGIHPWEVAAAGIDARTLDALRQSAARSDVVAVGETGIDTIHSGSASLFAQMNAFKAHVELSESLSLPLIIHSVKAQEIIIGIHRKMRPSQLWIIHGFRGKPSVMQMYLKSGIALSFGERFNAESLIAAPADMIFAETDESALSINEIIAGIHDLRQDIDSDTIISNTNRIFHK